MKSRKTFVLLLAAIVLTGVLAVDSFLFSRPYYCFCPCPSYAMEEDCISSCYWAYGVDCLYASTTSYYGVCLNLSHPICHWDLVYYCENGGRLYGRWCQVNCFMCDDGFDW